MGDHSAIEWTDATWNPTVGCDKVSAGCTHCYAITQAYRLEHGFKQPAYQGLTRKLPDGSVNWTGVVRTLPERLAIPLTWKKPARVFVDSMSDLFHEDVPDEFIESVFRIMAMCPQHTFQVLTKRPERMREFTLNRHVGTYRDHVLPNVWLGTSVEDQRAADERIPLLLQTPAAVRFLSAEPLLGPVNIDQWLWPDCGSCGHPTGAHEPPDTVVYPCDTHGCGCRGYTTGCEPDPISPPISWVIAGGESGPNFRPMDLDWARSIRDQCQAAGVAYFHKQNGGRTHAAGGRLLDGRTWDQFPEPAREAASVSR